MYEYIDNLKLYVLCFFFFDLNFPPVPTDFFPNEFDRAFTFVFDKQRKYSDDQL